MKYDPENPLSDEELDKLGEKDFDLFLEYLDSKTEYLKQFTKPLSSYHTKRYAALDKANQGKEITKEDIEKAGKIGKTNEKAVTDKIIEKQWQEKKHDMLKNNGVKNVKTKRDQWFD